MADRDRLTARPAPRAQTNQGPARAPVWVLDDVYGHGSLQAVGVAERLGVPFRRVPMRWNWLAPVAGIAPGGSLVGIADRAVSRRLRPPSGGVRPSLVLSAGGRAAAVSLWMKATLGCHAVHCAESGAGAALGQFLRRAQARVEHDLVVVPEITGANVAENVFPVLGPPHRVGPEALRLAAEQWGERLDYLARPRVVLLVGGRPFGTDMEPARAHGLARSVAKLVGGLGGSVMASTTRRTGREASDAVAAGLGGVMHLMYRWGEPGENPYLGYLALADAVIVTADSTDMMSEACATQAPVFLACAELAGPRQRRLARRMMEAGHVRPLRGDISPWPRTPLDEAGRVAQEIRRRIPLPAPRS